MRHSDKEADMKKVATIILAGGEGKRLFPLTQSCCKPALSFGGRYRLIDIPISNAINSGCQKIFVITQYLSSMLHQHIFSAYRFDALSSSMIEVLTSEERSDKVRFKGTADAVRQNLQYFENIPADYFLILSGDQVYSMDYRDMLKTALETDADAVIASLPIQAEQTHRMGILQVDDANIITSFHEKPQHMHELEPFRLSEMQHKRFGKPLHTKHYLASMGIYLFKRQVLIDLLSKDPREDFGKHIIPALVQSGRVAAHVHHGYWEDIGTIATFYEANMALTEKNPLYDCNNEKWRLYSSPILLPGAHVSNTHVENSILCEGTVIDAKEITHSIIGHLTTVQKGTIIRNSVVFGADPSHPSQNNDIGSDTIIDKAIIDRHVSIGNRVQLVNKQKLTTYDGDHIYIRDGIIIVTSGATIPDGFIL